MRASPSVFSGDVVTASGNWHADVTVSDSAWRPGGQVRVQIALGFTDAYLVNRAAAGMNVDEVCLLVTAERTFDHNGWMRLASDETVSTLLTPAGLAIEGGVQGAVTNRYGYPFKSPVDYFQSLPVAQIPVGSSTGTRQASFVVDIALPWDLPPGLYRVRVDFGVKSGKKLYDLNGYTFAARPFSIPGGTASYLYSPLLESSGFDVAGRYVDASTLQATCPWVLLGNYNSNGYRGVVADEDDARFALSPRTLIPDEVVLPMYSDGGSRLTYSLEPQFPVDQIDAAQNLPWNWASGEWSVKVTAPDGATTDLGTATFQAKAKYGGGPTTNWTAMTNWKPLAYGRYTVRATGWIADAWGRRYVGGGTYRFWIAKRMTLATATFQGMAYPVGTSYGRDIQFNPAMPADVQVTATLYPDSDPTAARELTYCGKASPGGLFGAAQGMKPFPLDAPGEYHAKVLATYTDPGGHLWVSVMRHAGIVYQLTSPVVARGKKISVGGKYVERGSTGREGYIESNGTQHLEHLTFPYLSGDVLLIASENQGANKVEPVLTYQLQGDSSAWDTKLNGVGTTNLRIKTSNGYAPHMFPEYITDIEYYYGAAPRPGFMGRFVVGESTSRAPYWAVSPNSFGGQIGSSANGDAPGDIYRLLGGVVLRRVGQTPMYAGYLSSAFLLPKGTNDNRIVAAGSEDFHGPMGEKARFFLVGLRPGTSYEVGATFKLGGQIDPILPAAIHFVLTYPDGRQQVADVTGDAYGAFGAPSGWTLDVPGVYRYQLTAAWNGHEGRMPGLPESGGAFFVYSKSRPPSAAGLSIDGSPHRTFSASASTTITGSSTGTSVHYTMVTPGAVIAQGELPVVAGKFNLVFDPVAVHAKVPLYDIVNNTTGAAQIGRVVHVTFFSQEFSGGQSFYDVTRVLLRGTTVLAARELLPDAERHVLTVTRTGEGTITVPTGQGGVECNSCSVPMTAGATVTLTATAAPGSIFTGWTGACSGTGSCTVTVSGATTVGAVFTSGAIHRRYFAEGAATTFFDCVFALANPGDTSAHVTMRFLKDGGTTVVHTLDVPPGARRSVDAKLVPGLAPAPGFSTVIESDVPLVADRTMSWDRTGYGMHSEVAIEAPARTWYLAEGSTQNGLQLYYLLENPNDREANVEVTYLRPAPLTPIVRLYTMAPLEPTDDPGEQRGSGPRVGRRVRSGVVARRRDADHRRARDVPGCARTVLRRRRRQCRRHVTGVRLVLRRGRHGRAVRHVPPAREPW